MQHEFAERLHKALHELGKLAFSNDRIGDLSRAEFKILFSINKMKKNNKDVTTADLSDRLYISKPAISQMMNLLEDKGFLSREINKNDRRVILVHLTKKGQKVIDEGIELYMKMLENTMTEMGEQNSKDFIELFEKYVECVKKVKDYDGENKI